MFAKSAVLCLITMASGSVLQLIHNHSGLIVDLFIDLQLRWGTNGLMQTFDRNFHHDKTTGNGARHCLSGKVGTYICLVSMRYLCLSSWLYVAPW